MSHRYGENELQVRLDYRLVFVYFQDVNKVIVLYLLVCAFVTEQ